MVEGSGTGPISILLNKDFGNMSNDVKAYRKSFLMMQDNFNIAKKVLGDLQSWDSDVESLTADKMKTDLKDMSTGIFIISQQEKAKERLKEKMINIDRADEVSSSVFKNRTDVFYTNLSIILAIISIVVITVSFS